VPFFFFSNNNMLREDYIMRLFQLFSESLAKWLSKRKSENSDLIQSFNSEVVKPYLEQDIQFFETKSRDQLVEYFNHIYPDKYERLTRLEILSEVLYQRATLETDSNLQQNIFNTTLNVLQYINSIDKTYSLARENRISDLLHR